MGHVIIRALLDGADIIGQSISDKSPDIRTLYFKYMDANARYGLYRFNEIPTKGEDFVIKIEVRQLEDAINWDGINFPDERVRRIAMMFIELHGIDKQLENTLIKIAGVRFEDRYALARLGNEAKSIIDKTPINPYQKYSEIKKSEAFEAIEHTLNKEVEIVESMKLRDSQQRKSQMLSSAINHLRSDITRFKSSLFWVDAPDESVE